MFLGIDQGTTGTTAVLLRENGSLLAKGYAVVPQHFPRPGWVEHQPSEIWLSVARAVNDVLTRSRTSAKKISAIGVTNQRETVSIFEQGRPLHPFIVWQDRRTSDFCLEIKHREKRVQKLAGLGIDPYFSATKINWIKAKLKLSSQKNLCFKTIDSFLLQKLTGAEVTEATNASRTSLMNLEKLSWDDELFEIFRVPRGWAPEIVSSEGLNLKTKNVGFLPDGIPVEASLGDQQAALFGQMGFSEGAGKITYGTGSFVLLNTGAHLVRSRHGLISTLAILFKDGKKSYALEGSAFICGAWIQWLRDQLRFIETSKASEALASAVKTSEGVFVIPALSGLGAPFWKSRARGALLGLTRGTGRAHIMRASLEALCFQNRALIEAMIKDLPKTKIDWRVDGGATENNLLLQIQANVLQARLIRPKNLEATATGVALLAAYSKAELSLSEIRQLWKKDRVFLPQSVKSYDQLYKDWKSLVSQNYP